MKAGLLIELEVPARASRQALVRKLTEQLEELGYKPTVSLAPATEELSHAIVRIKAIRDQLREVTE